ncbi:MAG: NADH dehydrogenase subunit M [Candidatus Xenobia bacterium]
MTLSFILAFPLAAALAVLLLPAASARRVAISVALLDMFLVAVGWQSQAPDETYRWIPALGISWSLSLDGLSALMAGLTALLTAVALGASGPRTERLSEFCGWLLLLLAFLQGVFLAANLGLFYLFWELMILPAFLLVGRWGGPGGRSAAFKFLLYTLLGSLAMLLALVLLAFTSSEPDLSYAALAARTFPPALGVSLLTLFVLGFAVKIPLVPLHGWQVDAYEAAPAPVAVVLAGAMSKAGLYGLWRVSHTFFPEALAELLPVLGTLALLSLLYGTICALGQTRTRRVLAYSSLAHTGMMTLGIVSVQGMALQGAGLQMLAHGLTTGGLFILLGCLEDRALPRDMDQLGGLARPMPIFGLALLVFSMAALGLPALCSFPGELMILTGLFQVNPGWALLACLSLVGAAWYLLRFYQRIANGEKASLSTVSDLNWREQACLVPLLVLVVWMGLKPSDWQTLLNVWGGQ